MVEKVLLTEEERRARAKQYATKYRDAHREELRAWHRENYAQNRERLLAKAKLRRQSDPNFRQKRRYQKRTRYAKLDYRLRQRAYNRDSKHRREFGVEDGLYDTLFEQQGGVCAICHQPEQRKVQGVTCALCVDHNHETGKVRGLLCAACNQAVGLMRENAERLRAAASYLDTHQC